MTTSLCKGKGLDTCAAYTSDQKRFAMSQMAVDWHIS